MNWLSMAFEASVLKRSLIVTLLVGTILMIINHGDTIVRAGVTSTHILKLVLTYIPVAIKGACFRAFELKSSTLNGYGHM